MIYNSIGLDGAFLIVPEKKVDKRGFFARTWCKKEFMKQGLESRLVQCNISFNHHRGTLRGMHYQSPPRGEVKLVRCTAGSIFDVIVDLRPESSTFMQHAGVTLSSKTHEMLYVPKGFAHGFLTLEDDTEVQYQMSEYYYPNLSRGFRWNDPAFDILWPENIIEISERDRNYPDFVICNATI